MEKPKRMILTNAAHGDHLEIMRQAIEQEPEATCGMCGKENVKCLPLTNTENPVLVKHLCFDCLTGEGMEVQDAGKPELN